MLAALWVLGSELTSSARTTSVHNWIAISSVPLLLLLLLSLFIKHLIYWSLGEFDTSSLWYIWAIDQLKLVHFHDAAKGRISSFCTGWERLFENFVSSVYIVTKALFILIIFSSSMFLFLNSNQFCFVFSLGRFLADYWLTMWNTFLDFCLLICADLGKLVVVVVLSACASVCKGQRKTSGVILKKCSLSPLKGRFSLAWSSPTRVDWLAIELQSISASSALGL